MERNVAVRKCRCFAFPVGKAIMGIAFSHMDLKTDSAFILHDEAEKPICLTRITWPRALM